MLPIIIEGVVRVPEWVSDLETFRRWTHSKDFPDRGVIAYLGNTLWIETGSESVAHNQAKGSVSQVLANVFDESCAGHTFASGMRVTHPDVGLSTEPDWMFVSADALRSGRMQIFDGPIASELVGTPDVVMEVISISSIEKDTLILPELYWKAGVREYWLVDPRGEEVHFDILTRAEHSFEKLPSRNGWQRSKVFDRYFKLGMTVDEFNLPVFTLEMKKR